MGRVGALNGRLQQIQQGGASGWERLDGFDDIHKRSNGVLYIHWTIIYTAYSAFSTRRCSMCLALAGVSESISNSSSTFLASALSVNTMSVARLSDNPP